MTKKRILMRKKTTLLFLTLMAVLLFMFPAFAGWNSSEGKNRITYSDESGENVKGLQTIGNRTYYFDKTGFLKTGWVSAPEGFRYFREDGKAGGKYGSMIAGTTAEINGYLYGFDEEGIVLTGFHELGGVGYFFKSSAKAGMCGRAVKDKFKKLPDGRRAYFQEDCRMARDKWIKDHTFCVDADGDLLRNTVTKDGYLLKKNGKVKEKLKNSDFVKLSGKWYFYKKKHGILKDEVFKHDGSYYYVDEDGVRQTGWISADGYDYYFESDGRAVTGKKTIDGKEYTFDAKGRLEGSREDPDEQKESEKSEVSGSVKVLILCGHGQGDSGAVGCNGKYMESVYTRDFGKRIYNALCGIEGVNAQLFNTNYDMFQQMKRTVSSVGSFSGNGRKRKKVLGTIRGNSLIPELTGFDYVLEIHFNATGYESKDPGGNGVIKGTGTYVNAYKSGEDRKIDKKIISALNSLGLGTWGSGVYGSAGLLNAKVFNEIGINYSLLETCFIDDKDDMKFYLKKRDDMAKTVAETIARYFG